MWDPLDPLVLPDPLVNLAHKGTRDRQGMMEPLVVQAPLVQVGHLAQTAGLDALEAREI